MKAWQLRWWWTDTYETLTANYCFLIYTLTGIIQRNRRRVEDRKMKMLRIMVNIWGKTQQSLQVYV